MESPVLNTSFNFANYSTNLPEAAQIDLSAPHWQQIYLIGVSVVAIPANLIVIACLWRDPSAQVTGFSTYAVSMAFTDLLIGVALIPLKLILMLWAKWPFGIGICIVWKIVDYGLTSVSMLLFLAMAHDRYRCVTAPLRYRSDFRTTRITRIAVSVWIVGFLLWTPYILLKILLYDTKSFENNCFFLTFESNAFEAIQIAVAFYILLLALVIMNSVLLWALSTRFSQSRFRKSAANVRQKPLSTVSGMIEHNSSPGQKPVADVFLSVKRGEVTHNRRSGMTSSYKIVIPVGLFCVCWVPYFITWPLAGQCGTCIPDGLRVVSGILPYGQSAINPLIFISTCHQIRSKIRHACALLSQAT